MVDEYTYLTRENDSNLESFSIERDFEYFIPLLKEILSINPNIKLIATPWSAPAEYKTGNTLYGSGMRDDRMDIYARYERIQNHSLVTSVMSWSLSIKFN